MCLTHISTNPGDKITKKSHKNIVPSWSDTNLSRQWADWCKGPQLRDTVPVADHKTPIAHVWHLYARHWLNEADFFRAKISQISSDTCMSSHMRSPGHCIKTRRLPVGFWSSTHQLRSIKQAWRACNGYRYKCAFCFYNNSIYIAPTPSEKCL